MLVRLWFSNSLSCSTSAFSALCSDLRVHSVFLILWHLTSELLTLTSVRELLLRTSCNKLCFLTFFWLKTGLRESPRLRLAWTSSPFDFLIVFYVVISRHGVSVGSSLCQALSTGFTLNCFAGSSECWSKACRWVEEMGLCLSKCLSTRQILLLWLIGLYFEQIQIYERFFRNLATAVPIDWCPIGDVS